VTTQPTFHIVQPQHGQIPQQQPFGQIVHHQPHIQAPDEQRHPQTAEQTTNFRWQPDETRVLVNTWKENYKVLQTHRSSTVWNSIRNEVNAVNAVKKCKPRTLDQCKDKIRRMKEEYTKAKTYNKDKTNVQNASCFGEQR